MSLNLLLISTEGKFMVSVGNTPLIEVDGIYSKLECMNPIGSVKDRIAKYIIEESEKKGLLKPGMKIVEATSGNTGISFSYFASRKGYPITIVMPENMSEERKSVIRGFGAELILCSEGNFQEAAQIRDEMAEDPNYFNPDQFSNPLNVECHYKTTGQEIIKQIREYSDCVDAFVAGVGTGGTLIGAGQALKDVFEDIKIVAVEPTESPVMSGGEPGIHGIQGIGDGFIPAIASDGKGGLHPLIDDVICISTEEAREAAKYLEGERCICVGMSSGANYLAAKKMQDSCKTVVTVFADGFSKYGSQGLKRAENVICDLKADCFSPDKKFD